MALISIPSKIIRMRSVGRRPHIHFIPFRFHYVTTPTWDRVDLRKVSFNQVTVVQGDAADEKTIQDLVSRTVKEEGHLDVFFANLSSHPTPSLAQSPPHKIHN